VYFWRYGTVFWVPN